MKYVDSNIFIYSILGDGSSKKTLNAKKILTNIVDGSIAAATSSLTWDEIVWSVKRVLGREVAKDEGRKFLEFPKLKFLDVDESTLYAAQKVIEKYSLKPRDAIHAACCIENGIDEIISDDPDFDTVKGLNRLALERA